jgi:hypothetical protein
MPPITYNLNLTLLVAIESSLKTQFVLYCTKKVLELNTPIKILLRTFITYWGRPSFPCLS